MMSRELSKVKLLGFRVLGVSGVIVEGETFDESLNP